MADSARALQKAVYDTLSVDTPLKALIGDPPRLYDRVPQNTAYPYLTLGDIQTRDWSTVTEAGADHRLTLHVWSAGHGRLECRDILDRAYTLLHDQNVALSGHTLVRLQFQSSEVFLDPDGKSYHGIAVFRAITEPVTP